MVVEVENGVAILRWLPRVAAPQHLAQLVWWPGVQHQVGILLQHEGARVALRRPHRSALPHDLIATPRHMPVDHHRPALHSPMELLVGRDQERPAYDQMLARVERAGEHAAAIRQQHCLAEATTTQPRCDAVSRRKV